MLEQLVFSSLSEPNLPSSPEVVRLEGEPSRGSLSLVSEDGHVASLQVHNGMETEGNGLQVTGQNSSGDTEA
ncbi:hypothetical protein Tco_0845967, partial [Tanacetum coccineum]